MPPPPSESDRIGFGDFEFLRFLMNTLKLNFKFITIIVNQADEEVYNDANDDEPMADLFKIQKFKHAPYQVSGRCFITFLEFLT